MNLIDHFNLFQVTSAVKGLSANARSLYYAILGEFNKNHFPETLKLENAYLQHLSGIYANSSFNIARSTLQNAKIISQSKNVYKLTPEISGTSSDTGKNSLKSMENPCKTNVKPVENQWKNAGKILEFPEPLSTTNKEEEEQKEKENPTTTPATAARTRMSASAISPPVAAMWLKYEGEYLRGGLAEEMYALEQIHGTPAVVEAIRTAALANKEPRLSFNFLVAVLKNRTKKAPPPKKAAAAAKNSAAAAVNPAAAAMYDSIDTFEG